MKKNILYLFDNNISYYNYKKDAITIDKIPKKIIIDGKIADYKKFNFYFSKYLNKHKLINSLFMEKIKIIINDTYTAVDKYILTEILEKNNFKTIEYLNEKNILNISRNAYLNLNEEYGLLYYKNIYNKIEMKFIKNNFFLTEKEFWLYIKKHIKNKNLYIYGNKKELIPNSKIEYYIFQNPIIFLLDNISNLKS